MDQSSRYHPKYSKIEPGPSTKAAEPSYSQMLQQQSMRISLRNGLIKRLLLEKPFFEGNARVTISERTANGTVKVVVNQMDATISVTCDLMKGMVEIQRREESDDDGFHIVIGNDELSIACSEETVVIKETQHMGSKHPTTEYILLFDDEEDASDFVRCLEQWNDEGRELVHPPDNGAPSLQSLALFSALRLHSRLEHVWEDVVEYKLSATENVDLHQSVAISKRPMVSSTSISTNQLPSTVHEDKTFNNYANSSPEESLSPNFQAVFSATEDHFAHPICATFADYGHPSAPLTPPGSTSTGPTPTSSPPINTESTLVWHPSSGKNSFAVPDTSTVTPPTSPFSTTSASPVLLYTPEPSVDEELYWASKYRKIMKMYQRNNAFDNREHDNGSIDITPGAYWSLGGCFYGPPGSRQGKNTDVPSLNEKPAPYKQRDPSKSLLEERLERLAEEARIKKQMKEEAKERKRVEKENRKRKPEVAVKEEEEEVVVEEEEPKRFKMIITFN